MSDKNTAATTGGVGCLSMLGLIFIALKLAEVGQVATWSWWWVLAPFWGQIIILIGIVSVVFLIAFIAHLLDS